MTRIMYDSVTANDIPVDALMVGGYLPPSSFAWSPADWARFPNAVHVRIAVRASTDDGDVLDVERGDATPLEAPGWVVRRRAAGVDPSVYCSASEWPAVRQAFHNANVPEPHYWIAHYDGIAAIPAGAVAKQYRNPPSSGGHFDLSIVADYWPGVDRSNNMADPTIQEMHDRIMGFLQQRYVTLGDDGVTLNVVDAATPGARPARALDEADGNHLARMMSALNTKLDNLIKDGVTVVADGVITIHPK